MNVLVRCYDTYLCSENIPPEPSSPQDVVVVVKSRSCHHRDMEARF